MKAIALFGAHDHGKLDAWLRIVREHGGTFLPQKTALMLSMRGMAHHDRYVRVMADIPSEQKVSFELCVHVSGVYTGQPALDDLHAASHHMKSLHPMWRGFDEEI
ncbi:hypothetical protein HZC00_04545 [Candidatus Kaiserbacteria bacterium]|nr:hypothetical protein [Candidatus Kaiserbacteria bacterium]